MGLALFRGHAEEVRRGQNHARRFALALRTALRRVAFRHRPHVRERAAVVAEILVNRHFISSRVKVTIFEGGGCGAADTRRPAPRRAGITYPVTAASGCRP